MFSDTAVLVNTSQSCTQHEHTQGKNNNEEKQSQDELASVFYTPAFGQADFTDLNHYLSGNNEHLSQGRDEEQLLISALMNDLSNIRQTQQSYGIPAIGDLFRAKPEDVQETINSIYYMLKQRVADLEFRQEARQKWTNYDLEKQDHSDQLNRLRQKQEQVQSENKDLKNQLANLESKFKAEREKFAQERDESSKQLLSLRNKETHYKHEIKSRDTQIEKLKESIRVKFDKPQANTTNSAQGVTMRMGQLEQLSGVGQSELKYTSLDFQLMISKNQDEILRRLSDENAEIKECLKSLQRELFEIVDLKSEIYMKRYRAEYGQSAGQQSDAESEEVIKHELDRIREELFNLPFEESGKEIIQKFQTNFSKLKDFMEKIDKEVSQLNVFNQKDDSYDDPTSKFSGITSIQQLKHLLKSYDGLVEGQHTLLTQSITKMSKIPAPDEISSTFNRFQILKESELDEMRQFLNEQQQLLGQQHREFQQEKQQMEQMEKRMEGEKSRISEERERIEQEVRRIKEVNQQIAQSIYVK